MIPKQHRLQRVRLLSPRSVRTKHFLLKIVVKTEGPSQFGFVISKKKVATAVMRNRTRRLLAACSLQLLSEMQEFVDVVIIVTSMPDTTHDAICVEIKKALGVQKYYG